MIKQKLRICPKCGKRKLKKNLFNGNLECSNPKCNYINSQNNQMILKEAK